MQNTLINTVFRKRFPVPATNIRCSVTCSELGCNPLTELR